MDGFNFKEVKIKNKTYRVFDESFTGIETIFYIETTFKLKELINNFNLKVYYIKTKPRTDSTIQYIEKSFFDSELKIFSQYKNEWKDKPDWIDQSFEEFYFKKKNFKVSTTEELEMHFLKIFPLESIFWKKRITEDLKHDDVQKIKNFQSEDLYHLYSNMLFEVLYVIPKLLNDVYYYELIVVINQKTDLNKIINYNFNLVEIVNTTLLCNNNITFDFIANLFNNYSFKFSDVSFDSEIYDWNGIRDTFEETKFLKNNPNISSEQFWSINYWIDNKVTELLDEKKYAKTLFRNLSYQIYSFDTTYVKCYDERGMFYWKEFVYDMNSTFITNHFQLMGAVSVNINDDKNIIVDDETICWNTLSDNSVALKLSEWSFSKEFLMKGFINFSNLKKVKKKDLEINNF